VTEDAPAAGGLRSPSRLMAVAASPLARLRQRSKRASALDRIARLAAGAAVAPAGAVTLLDEHYQWVLGAAGTLVRAQPRGLTVGESLCQHVVTSGRPVAIEEIDRDDRIDQVVRERAADAGFRSYLGVPLAIDGAVLGAVCVLDDRARRWSDDDIVALQDAAALIADGCRWRTLALTSPPAQRPASAPQPARPIVLTVDADGTASVHGGEGLTVLGVRPQDVADGPLPEVLRALVGNRPDIRSHVERALAGEAFQTTLHLEDHVFRAVYAPRRLPDGGRGGALVLLFDRTDVSADFAGVDDRPRAITSRDADTAPSNPALRRTQVQAFVDRAVEAGDRIAALVVELTDFRGIKSTMGHDVASRVLDEIGDRLRIACGPAAMMSAHGGSGFRLAVPLRTESADGTTGGTAQQAVASLVDRLLCAARRPIAIDAVGAGVAGTSEISVSPVVGVSVAPEHGTDVQGLVDKADAALAHAARGGRESGAIYREGLDNGTHRLVIASRLRHAIDEKQVTTHLQPIFEIATGQTVSFEALARWTDDEFGAVSPEEFVTVAQDTGLITELTDLVIDSALHAAARIDELAGCRAAHPPNDGGRRPDGCRLWVGVNVCPEELDDAALADRLFAAAARHGVPLDSLVVELTETAALRDDAAARTTMRRLADAGVKLVIDDFGIGYSNVGRLRDLASDGLVHAVKLDKSFVRDLPSAAAAALISAFLRSAAALDIDVIAEGIETAEQAAALMELGCVLGQGWYYARAMPEAEAIAWTLARRSRAAK